MISGPTNEHAEKTLNAIRSPQYISHIDCDPFDYRMEQHEQAPRSSNPHFSHCSPKNLTTLSSHSLCGKSSTFQLKSIGNFSASPPSAMGLRTPLRSSSYSAQEISNYWQYPEHVSVSLDCVGAAPSSSGQDSDSLLAYPMVKNDHSLSTFKKSGHKRQIRSNLDETLHITRFQETEQQLEQIIGAHSVEHNGKALSLLDSGDEVCSADDDELICKLSAASPSLDDRVRIAQGISSMLLFPSRKEQFRCCRSLSPSSFPRRANTSSSSASRSTSSGTEIIIERYLRAREVSREHQAKLWSWHSRLDDNRVSQVGPVNEEVRWSEDEKKAIDEAI